MRELIKDNQLVTIVPQDFKKTNKGRVLEVSPEGFRMELKYKPDGYVIFILLLITGIYISNLTFKILKIM